MERDTHKIHINHISVFVLLGRCSRGYLSIRREITVTYCREKHFTDGCDARIAKQRSSRKSPPRPHIEPCRVHCRFHGSSATQRVAERPSQITGTLTLQPELYIIAAITVVSNIRRIFARTSPRLMSEHAFTAPLRVRIFVQLCVTSGHYRVSRRGSLPDLSLYVVEHDFEYPQSLARRSFCFNRNRRSFRVTSATIKMTKGKLANLIFLRVSRRTRKVARSLIARAFHTGLKKQISNNDNK